MNEINTHGGDIYGVAAKLGILPEQCLDFSANINPLGIPSNVKSAMEQAVSRLIHYPDPECRTLTTALAGHLSTKPEYLLCGNGGADLIYRIVYAAKPGRALLPVPSFLEYGEALRQTDTEIVSYQMDDDMNIREDILDLISPEIDILFLCTPNNPTGLLIPEDILIAILKKTAGTGTRIVIDECFMDFVEPEKRYSMLPFVETHPNLVIIRSFTKLYGIPGIRLGYGISSDTVFLRQMKTSGQTWPVNAIAMAAGVAALKEDDFRNQTVAYIKKEREWLKEELKALGFRVYDGQADYLFFHASGCEHLYETLLADGIIIRRCCNYQTLSNEHYRIAVKGQEDNRVLIQCLKRILKREGIKCQQR